MLETSVVKPLGVVLQQAGLVSAAQIEIALAEQKQAKNLRLGEILALKGWIEQKTADFFAEELPQIWENSRKPIGQYLKKAGLLNERQIEVILKEQQKTGLKFGVSAVLKGWIEPKTINFFLEHLNSEKKPSLDRQAITSKCLENLRDRLIHNQHSPVSLLKLYKQILEAGSAIALGTSEEGELLKLGLLTKQKNRLKIAHPIYKNYFNRKWVERELTQLQQPYGKIRLKLLKLDQKASLPYKVLAEIIAWTGNQPFLTQKLSQLIYNNEFFIPEGKEEARVEELVQTRVIDNWEFGAAAEHFQKIVKQIRHNQNCSPALILKLYKRILQRGEVLAQGTPAEAELIEIGVIVKKENQLKISNRIYRSVFNEAWLYKELATLVGSSMEKTAARDLNQVLIPVKKSQKQNLPLSKLALAIGLLFGIITLGVIGGNLLAMFHLSSIFGNANELLKNEEYDRALVLYNKIIKIDGEYYQAWTNRGYALAGLQEYDRMLESCSSATIIEPDALYAWNCQGEALYNQGKYDEALTAFDRAISLNPTEPIFWLNQSETFFAMNQGERALEAIEKAIALLEEIGQGGKTQAELAVAFSNKGKIHLKNEENSAALESFNRALEYNPNYFGARRGKGIALKKLQQNQEAIAIFEEILTSKALSKAQRAETQFYLGLTLCQLSQSEKAIAAFDRAMELKPNYEAAARAKANCR